MVEAMLDMIVDELALGIGDGILHRVQLLRNIETGSPDFDHGQSGTQMPFRSFQTFHDFGM